MSDFLINDPTVVPAVKHVVKHAAAHAHIVKPAIQVATQGTHMLTTLISSAVSSAVAFGLGWYIRGRGLTGVKTDIANIYKDLEELKAKFSAPTQAA